MHLKSLGELKTSTLYRTGFPCGYCPPKHKRGLPSPAFSLPKLSLRSLCPLPRGICSVVPWSLWRPLCSSSFHLLLLQISSPAAQASQILWCFSEDSKSVAEVRPCFRDQRAVMDLYIRSLGKAFFHRGEKRSWYRARVNGGACCRYRPGARKAVATKAFPLHTGPAPLQQHTLAATAELLRTGLSARENVMMEPSCC